eukprot:10131238-Prorocentrum_lima.AAC.1
MSEEEGPELELTYEGRSDRFVEARGAAHNFDKNDVAEEVITAPLCTTCGKEQCGPRFVAM